MVYRQCMLFDDHDSSPQNESGAWWEHVLDASDRRNGIRLNERWYLGKPGYKGGKFGLVREGARTEFAITRKGLRITLKF